MKQNKKQFSMSQIPKVARAIGCGLLLLGSAAHAANLSVDELKQRFELHADIYVMSKDGTKIISGPERTNHWKADPKTGRIRGGWSSNFENGLISILQEWRVSDSGTIEVRVAEYSEDVRDHDEKTMKAGSLLEKKEFTLKNLEPLIWPVKNIKNANLVLRFVPTIRESKSVLNVDSLPIAGEDVDVFDSEGYHWASGLSMGGKFSGFKSHRGTLVLSYSAFKGAREMGTAEGLEIILSPEVDKTITLRSKTAFLPSGIRAKVFALYLPEKKSSGPRSLHGFDSTREDRILQAIER